MANDPTFAPVEQMTQTFSKQPGISLETTLYKGPAKVLLEKAKNLKVGFEAPMDTGGTWKLSGFIAGVNYRRVAKQLAELEIATCKREPIEIWELSWMCIQKPIKTWLAEDDSPPSLGQIERWEALKGNTAYSEDYNNFTIPGEGSTKEVLEGNTLRLAQKIRKGIEAYELYTPVLTRRTQINQLPASIGKNINKICVPAAVDATGDANVPGVYVALAQTWRKTDDHVQGLLDGSKQRNETWVGADAWDPDLYETASGEGGGGLDTPDLPPTPDL